jgi:hypothetical protein
MFFGGSSSAGVGAGGAVSDKEQKAQEEEEDEDEVENEDDSDTTVLDAESLDRMTKHWLARAAGCILRPHPEMFQQIQFFLEAPMKQPRSPWHACLWCLSMLALYVLSMLWCWSRIVLVAHQASHAPTGTPGRARTSQARQAISRVAKSDAVTHAERVFWKLLLAAERVSGNSCGPGRAGRATREEHAC